MNTRSANLKMWFTLCISVTIGTLAHAQETLADLNSILQKKDYTKAEQLLESNKEKLNPEQMRIMGLLKLQRPDTTAGIYWIRKAASADNKFDMLYDLYARGYKGFPVDTLKALATLTNFAVATKNTEAMIFLAGKYSWNSDRPAAISSEQASRLKLYWYKTAADNGNKTVYSLLGWAYKDLSDYSTALSYFKKAIDNKDPYGASALSSFYQNGGLGDKLQENMNEARNYAALAISFAKDDKEKKYFTEQAARLPKLPPTAPSYNAASQMMNELLTHASQKFSRLYGTLQDKKEDFIGKDSHFNTTYNSPLLKTTKIRELAFKNGTMYVFIADLTDKGNANDMKPFFNTWAEHLKTMLPNFKQYREAQILTLTGYYNGANISVSLSMGPMTNEDCQVAMSIDYDTRQQ